MAPPAEPRGRAVGARRRAAVGHGAAGADHRRAPQPDDFYRESHGRIYQAMLDLHTQGEPVDALTLVEHLKQAGELDSVGGAAAIELLAGSVPAVGNVRQYARIVRENAMLRRLLHASYEIQAQVHGHEALPRDLVDMAERIDPRGRPRGLAQGLPLDRAAAGLRARQAPEALARGQRRSPAPPSGFEDLDNITGGFQPGNLIILAARPSMGKSALMANFAENAALTSNKAVALFSLEMSEGELAQRFIASQASIKGDDLRKGRVPAGALGQDPAGVGAARAVEAVHRRLVGPLGARRAREGAPARAAERRRARADPDRLPAADAGGRQRREPRRADRPDLARAEDARARARGARDRAVPAQPRRRAADRQAARALRPTRVRLPDGRNAACTCRMRASTGASTSSSGMRDFRVSALNTQTWKLEPCRVSRAFSTGHEAGAHAPHAARAPTCGPPRTTAFSPSTGWRRLDELAPGDLHRTCRASSRVPAYRRWPTTSSPCSGHLIGDGCTFPRHAIQYTTREPELAEIVAALATRVFGDRSRSHASSASAPGTRCTSRPPSS